MGVGRYMNIRKVLSVLSIALLLTSCSSTSVNSLMDKLSGKEEGQIKASDICYDARTYIPRVLSDDFVIVLPYIHRNMFPRKNGTEPVPQPYWAEFTISDDSETFKIYDPKYQAIKRGKSESEASYNWRKQRLGKRNLTYYAYDFSQIEDKEIFARRSVFQRCGGSKGFFSSYFEHEPNTELRLAMLINSKLGVVAQPGRFHISKIYTRGDVCKDKVPELYAIYDIGFVKLPLSYTPRHYLKAAQERFQKDFYINNSDFTIVLTELTKAYFLEKCKDPSKGFVLPTNVKFSVVALNPEDYYQTNQRTATAHSYQYWFKKYRYSRMTWPFTVNIPEEKTTKYDTYYEGNLVLHSWDKKDGVDKYSYLLQDEGQYLGVRLATIDNHKLEKEQEARERKNRQQQAELKRNQFLAPFIGFLEGVTLGYSDELICKLRVALGEEYSYKNCHYNINREYDEIISSDRFTYLLSNMAGLMFSPTSSFYPDEWHETPSGRAKIEAIEGVIQTIGESNEYRPVTAEDIVINASVGAAVGAGVAKMRGEKR